MNHLNPELEKALARRRFIQAAGAGTVVLALGGVYVLSDELTREAQAQTRSDGRPRLPPGQRVIQALRPMGGEPGEPSPSAYRLRVYGEVGRAIRARLCRIIGATANGASAGCTLRDYLVGVGRQVQRRAGR